MSGDIMDAHVMDEVQESLDFRDPSYSLNLDVEFSLG